MAGTAQAATLNIAATTGNLAAVAREVGGDAVRVSTLAPPDRALAGLEVKPAMVQALRGADLLLTLGNGLEDRWLTAAITQAANPKGLAPGQENRLDVTQVQGRNAPEPRPGASPQAPGQSRLDLDPVRMGEVARVLAQRLETLDPARGTGFAARADGFVAKLFAWIPKWQVQARRPEAVLLYAADPLALFERFGLTPLAVIETTPGVTPTGAELADLIGRMQTQHPDILAPDYADPRVTRLLANRIESKVVTLPLDVAPGADGAGYLDHIGRWMDAITSQGDR